FSRIGLLTLLVASIYACNKEETQGPPTSLTQMTSGIAIAHADTSLGLSWTPGLAAGEGDDRQTTLSYEVQVCTDSTFRDADQNAVEFGTESIPLFLGHQEITPLEKVFVGVRTVAGSGTGSSGWMSTPCFQLKPIDLIRPIKVGDLTQDAAIFGFARH